MSRFQAALNAIYGRGPGIRPGRRFRRGRLSEEIPVPTPEGQPDDGQQWHRVDDHLGGCPVISYAVPRAVGDPITLRLSPSLEVGWSIDGQGHYAHRKYLSNEGLDKVLATLSPVDVAPFVESVTVGRRAWVEVMRESAATFRDVAAGIKSPECREAVAAFVRFDVALDVLAQVDATLALAAPTNEEDVPQ